MNFLNGMWLTREGFTPHRAKQAYSAVFDGETLTIVAPTRVIRNRGDTLNLPVLTVRFSSPAPDIICCTAVHHAGAQNKEADFCITNDHPAVQFIAEDHSYTFVSGRLRAVILRGEEWNVNYYFEGRLLTSSSACSLAYFSGQEQNYLCEMLDMDIREQIYGFGEQFTTFVKNGQRVVCRNEDGGTCTPQAYKTVPLYLSSKGYGVFVNTPAPVEFEVGSEVVSKVQFSVQEESLSYFVLGGVDLKAVLERYTHITGRSPSLPPWSHGLWLSTSFTTNYDEATTSAMIEGMFQRDIPLDVFHYDCFWMKGFQWCDFTFDADTFPDPAGMLARNHERGLKNCCWINPYIAQLSPLFQEGMQNGYLLKKPDGTVWQWDLWQAGMAIVDFTNPAACDWFRGKLTALLELGVDCFKTDFGERIPTGVCWYNGSDPARMHNLYSHLYNQLVFDLLVEKRGKNEAVLFARSATAGCQQFPLHWGGDCNGTFASMAESLRGGLSLGMCGFTYWSHDIGGFETEASPAVFKRWIVFGLLSSHSRLHGSKGYRVPWVYDEESVAVLRFFTHLKLSLMPYLFAQSLQSASVGLPVLRPMVLEFCGDINCRALDTQYLLGENLLVAPVFSEAEATFYLPQGRWTSLLTGETLSSGWHTRTYNYCELPLFVRPGTLLATCPGSHKSAEYDYTKGLRYTCYEPAQDIPATCTIYHRDGVPAQTATALLHGNSVLFTLDCNNETVEFQIGGKTATLLPGETSATILL